MWRRSIYLKTLRDYRVAVLGWGVGMGLLLYAVLAAVPSLLTTPEARASLVGLAGSFAWLAEPVAVDTPGGYATWKYGVTLMVIAIWPLLACSRLLRGEEERGSLDVLLSLPRGRWRIALEKLAAVWTALLAVGLLIGLLSFAGGQNAGADFGLSGALLFGLDLALICGVFGSIALLLSQFTLEHGTASGITGGLLLGSVVLDMVHRVLPGAEWLSRLSPVYYYNLSKPLIPSYGVNPGAMLVLFALSLLLTGAALALFARRDLGRTVALPGLLPLPTRPERALPINAWSLRSVYRRGLGMLVGPACWWTLGIAGFAGWMVVVVQQTEASLTTLSASSPLLSDFITGVGGGDRTANATLLSALFAFLPLLLMTFAVTQANRWSADEEDGRLELVLSTPRSRTQVLLGRFAALSTATAAIAVLTLVTTAAAVAATGLALDGGKLAAATLSIVPLALLIAALGYLLSGWLRTAVDTGLLSLVLLIWFFVSFIGPELHWSERALRLSAFYYYGTPLLHGLPLGNMLGILAVGATALMLATVRFGGKDLGQ